VNTLENVLRIFIVEDDPLLLQNLTLLLEGEKNIEVVGTASNAEDAVEALKELRPHILLSDLGLPKMPGVELIRHVASHYPDILIIAHTIFEESDTVFEAIRAGASGYLLKTASPRMLVESLFELFEGGAPMSPKIARKVIAAMQQERIEEQYLLSHRELEVLKLIEKGESYGECAKALHVSVHTINSHIKNIYKKLNATCKSEALLKARQKGIL